MADPTKAIKGGLKAIQAASKAADEQLAVGKLKAALEAQQAPMTRPQGTGLPLMPRDNGMYTLRDQKDLPRMPTVDKARAANKSPKYNERTQDLLDSPKARKKVDSLINKGKDLNVQEWYGTEPLRQVAMDAGRTPEQFESMMAQLASASQRNPVDKQNQMGSYLYHLSETGQLPDNSLLLTNKLKKALKDDPSLAEGRTLIELPTGYGSLAQGDIFNRALMISQGKIGEALPPNKKLGTFYENLLGNLRPVTVDVNALRGPIIEQGDPRWLASKLVEKDDKGKIINSYKPREMFNTGEMTMREAQQRPGFWEAAPKGSEYAGFEELWQRGAKRHNIEPAEAQALGWYGSADVTALKTKPENYVDNLERLIKRTAEQTGKSPTEVMNDMVTGKGFLRKEGGAVERKETAEEMDKFHKCFNMHKAFGGAVVKKVEGGKVVKGVMGAFDKASKMADEKLAADAIGKAAESAGMKAPVTANKPLTGLQDFHTSLLDKVRENTVNAKKEMDAFDYQYDKGQRVFTEDSAKKNRAPYEILERYRHGNQVMRADHPTLGANMGQPIRDPNTGKVMRTPYEAGYRVRGEIGEMIIPESAIKGSVDMARGGAMLTPTKKTEGFKEEKPMDKSILEKMHQAVKEVPKLPTSPLGVVLNLGYEGYKYFSGKDPVGDFQKEVNRKLNPKMDTGSAPVQEFEKFAKGGRVQESPEEMARFHKCFAMHKAFGGAVKKPQKFDDGGIASPEESYASDGKETYAGLLTEFLAKAAKDQGKEELSSLSKPRAATDLLNRGVLANNPVSAVIDMVNMGLIPLDVLGSALTGRNIKVSSDKPFLGSEHLKDLMKEYNITSGEERPMMETALSFASPAAMIKGAQKTADLAKKAPEALSNLRGGLEQANLDIPRPLRSAVLTMEAVNPNLGQKGGDKFKHLVTKRMISGEGAPVSMERMGGRKTEQTMGQGLYENFAKQLETNPMVGITIPRAGNLSTNKRLIADIGTAGRELGQEMVAAHRFTPLLFKNPKDATAMMIGGSEPLTKDQIRDIYKLLPGMIVTHSPKNNSIFVAPFEGDALDYKKAAQAASEILGKSAKVQFGKADSTKDIMYRGDYDKMEARPPSAESTAMQNRLKKAEERIVRGPSVSQSGRQSPPSTLTSTVR